MNVYFNTQEDLTVNRGLVLPRGTHLYLENENAKEHRLGEDRCATYRLIVDDEDFFNPFRECDIKPIMEAYSNPVQFGSRSYSRKEFINKVLLNKDTNKAAIVWKHTKAILRIEGYLAAYYLDGAMMCLYLLEDIRVFVTDRVGYHARVSFRDAKGYDPITLGGVMKIKI